MLIFCGKMTIILISALLCKGMREYNSGLCLGKPEAGRVGKGRRYMQINGVGSEHNSGHHNVTNCLHEHSMGKKESGAFRSIGIDSLTLSNQNTISQQEGQLSLSAWLDKTLRGGKDLLQRIWGNDPTAVTNGTGGQSLEMQALVALSDEGAATGAGADARGQSNYGLYGGQSSQSLHTSQIVAASSMVQSEAARVMHQNPYFVTVDEDRPKNIWQKMKVKMKDMAGRLSGRMPRRFAGFWAKGAFQTKQEQPKEDLRKKSKYRQDKLEIDCVLTDDSYLQDSYNSKGEYSKLAGDVQKGYICR